MPGDGEDSTRVIYASEDARSVSGDGGTKPVRRFTSSELRKLSQPHNAHIAVRGKVSRKIAKRSEGHLHLCLCFIY